MQFKAKKIVVPLSNSLNHVAKLKSINSEVLGGSLLNCVPEEKASPEFFRYEKTMTTEFSNRKMLAETKASGPSLNPDLTLSARRDLSGYTEPDDLYFQLRKSVIPTQKTTTSVRTSSSDETKSCFEDE